MRGCQQTGIAGADHAAGKSFLLWKVPISRSLASSLGLIRRWTRCRTDHLRLGLLIQRERVRQQLLHRAQNLPRLLLKVLRPVLVARVREQQRQQHHPRRSQRPPRPPQVQRTRMPVPNRLLPRRVPRHFGDGEIDSARRLHSRGIIGVRSSYSMSSRYECDRNAETVEENRPCLQFHRGLENCRTHVDDNHQSL